MSEFNEGSNVYGFDIPKRELTTEEATRDLTLQRFQEFNRSVGEDFTDQFPFVNVKIFGGYLMAKYPTLSADLLKIINDKYGEALSILHMFEEELEDEENEIFYTDLANFVNLTGNLKKQVNQVLIQVAESYE